MRNLLKSLGIYFLAVAIPRVALFANNFTIPAPEWGWLNFNPWNAMGLLFALGLGLGVYVFSYYASKAAPRTDTEKAKESDNSQKKAYIRRRNKDISQRKATAMMANGAAILFALADSIFNMAEVSEMAIERSQIVSLVQPIPTREVVFVAVWIFGLFPTIGSLVAGLVLAGVERIPDINDGYNQKKQQKPKKKVSPGSLSSTPTVRTNGNGHRPKVKRNANGKKGQFLATYAGMARTDIDVQEIATDYEVDERTVYRWLNTLEGKS